MSTYDQLHRQCRTLENLFYSKLTSYSQLVSTISRHSDDVEASGSSERWMDMEHELDDLLEKLEETNEQLAALANEPDAVSASMLRTINHHAEIFQDNARELRRTKASVKSALDHANLLHGVRNDIEAYRSSAADSLLAERGRIDSSHSMTDVMIEQAYENSCRVWSAENGIGWNKYAYEECPQYDTWHQQPSIYDQVAAAKRHHHNRGCNWGLHHNYYFLHVAVD